MSAPVYSASVHYQTFQNCNISDYEMASDQASDTDCSIGTDQGSAFVLFECTVYALLVCTYIRYLRSDIQLTLMKWIRQQAWSQPPHGSVRPLPGISMDKFQSSWNNVCGNTPTGSTASGPSLVPIL